MEHERVIDIGSDRCHRFNAGSIGARAE